MEEMKFQSEKRLDMLKKRTKRCCCKYCGGNLILKKIVFSDFEDSRVEIFCEDCDRIEFGVEKEIYLSAKFFADETGFNCYPELEENARSQQMNIAKLCEIMEWENQNLGILDKNGFQVPLKLNENFLGECITLTERDLDEA